MTSRTRVLAAALLAPLLTLTACSGDEGGKGDGDPADVLGAAKTALDETSGVHLVLAADDLPDDISGVVKAEGDATHAPAFKGDIIGRFEGIEATIKVIAVDGVVYVVLPFSSDYQELENPEDYGAPDPAGLMDPSSGVSAWLTATTDVEKGEQTRDGGDVLTTYTGTLPGANVVAALPSADETGSFEASYAIDDEGFLRSATITGPFYKGEPDVTYELTLSDYGTNPDISAP
ncbi:MAG TPA: LppX_LprAFG lipoprotein [Nocardioidaceae bacterium]|nr:LppX_LprAFG lipoprotein [Nocardioidaceae bacterium]